MNKPADITSSSPAYEADLYGWAMAQAELLRLRRPEAIDWSNIAEEIEATGKSERRAVTSALRILLLHLLKWDFQTDFRSRSWLNSIREHGQRFQEILGESPSLNPQLDEVRAIAFRGALVGAVNETGLARDAFPADPPGWNLIYNPPVSESDIDLS